MLVCDKGDSVVCCVCISSCGPVGDRRWVVSGWVHISSSLSGLVIGVLSVS